MRSNRFRSLGWCIALTILVQAIAFGWTRPAVAEETDAPQIEGWVICTAHSEAPSSSTEPAKDGKSAARHDLTCTMCVAGHVAPMVLATTDLALPIPSERGRIERIAASALQPRAPPFSLPNARAPPSLS